MKLQLNHEVLSGIDNAPLSKLIPEIEYRNYFLDVPGKEHYKLLMYISTLFNNTTLLDIGSYKGCSALALSYNPSNIVHSFDVGTYLQITEVPTNVQFYIGYATDPTYTDLILNSPFIMLDTAHDGIFERLFHNHLLRLNWNGILCLDDIHLNQEMKLYWESITEPKVDISEYGHWSGTGLVFFGENYGLG
jgi:hypothetical protein